MTITYKRPFSDRSTRVPILHKVYYGDTARIFSAVSPSPKFYPRHDCAVLDWCKENCKAAWYSSPAYVDQCYIEFEDDEDALMFALKWS